MDKTTYKFCAQTIANYFLSISIIGLLSAAVTYRTRPVFHLPEQDRPTSVAPSFPITATFLQDVTQIGIQSQLGNFSLNKYKDNSTKLSKWKIAGVNRLPAQEDKVISLLRSFSTLEVVNTFDMSLANTQSFQLDRPLSKLTFSNGDETVKVRIGMVKPHERKAYLAIDGHSQIFEIKFIKYPLQLLTPQGFVEKSPFSYKVSAINGLNIFKGTSNRAHLRIIKKHDLWLDSKRRGLSSNKINKFINSLKNIKIEAIVDHVQNYEKELKRFLAKPLYNMTIKSDEETINLRVAKVVKGIPNMRIPTKGHYLLSSSDRKSPFIISKKAFNIFKTKEKQLKEITIGDVIY